jgi:hypothetical protein
MIRVGYTVNKKKGYEFLSVVVARFETQSGEIRVVCESLKIPGLLHIFSPDQMIMVVPGGIDF